MDDTDEMFQLADLLEGVSVDCAELPSETNSSGINNCCDMHTDIVQIKFYFFSTHQQKYIYIY